MAGVTAVSGLLRQLPHNRGKASDNLAAALEQDIARNFLTLDLLLQGVAEALALPGINDTTPQVRQAALFDRAATVEHLGVITVVDA